MRTHSPTHLPGPISTGREWWHAAEAAAAEGELFRAALVEQVRKEIAAGTYDTPEKWDAALDRLLDRLEKEQQG